MAEEEDRFAKAAAAQEVIKKWNIERNGQMGVNKYLTFSGGL